MCDCIWVYILFVLYYSFAVVCVRSVLLVFHNSFYSTLLLIFISIIISLDKEGIYDY